MFVATNHHYRHAPTKIVTRTCRFIACLSLSFYLSHPIPLCLSCSISLHLLVISHANTFDIRVKNTGNIMQYTQIPHTSWTKPYGYNQSYTNYFHHHLSSNASSLADRGSSTSYQYDALPCTSSDRLSPRLYQSTQKVVIQIICRKQSVHTF
jgi:hypothetical protein